MQQFDWDDLRVFLAIRRFGNLSSAARELKVSQPTVGRRLRSLEGILSARLFERFPEGYVPTDAGNELLPLAEQMEQAADTVARRQASFADAVRGTVRISIFEQTSQFITDHVTEIRAKLPQVEIEMSVAHTAANLSRREADLLIRECLPDSPGLISRRLGKLSHCIYGSKEYVSQHPEALTGARFESCDWIGPDDDHLYFVGQKWLREKLNGRLPAVRSNNGMVFYDATRKHSGLAILPCFVGDGDSNLVRVSDPLEDVVSTHYLLVHQDLRRSPAVRAMMNALVELYQENTKLLLGN